MAVVHVPMDEAAEVIRELLAAAQDLGLDPTTSVKTSSDGFLGFSLIVPDEVYDRAGFNRIMAHATPKDPEPDQEPAPKPAKKAAAKKAAAKKAAEPVVEEEHE